MRKTRVGLVQINNSFSGQHYFPYSVGLLQAYAVTHLEDPESCEFLPPIHNRVAVADAANRLCEADIVAFSMYVWNEKISLRIAEEIKRRNPDVFLVFGGPHVPNRSEDLLRKNTFIDTCVQGEGERVFLQLLKTFRTSGWRDTPSVSYIAPDGRYVQNPRIARLNDMSHIPSPYLMGIFDPLMEANPGEHWIAMWETNRGCPFSCTFCDWGSAVASKVYSWEIERLYQEVDWFAQNKIEYVFCADANFGILPRDVDLARYCADTKRVSGYPQALSVQNAKNATERSYLVQKILSDAGLNKGVVVSLQSVDSDTLKAIKRDNIKLSTYYEIQRRFAAEGVETMSDLILGLPGETYESFTRGVSSLIDNGQHNRVQFNNLSILPNAEMGDPEYLKKYGMITVETIVVNAHGENVESLDEILETQELVIGTDAMPREDWVKTRVFCWMSGLLHFDKVLQIPLVLLHETVDQSYDELIRFFAEGSFRRLVSRPDETFPLLSRVCAFFTAKALDIQNAGTEYCYSREWLNIWWPADEYILIEMCIGKKLGAFYDEAEKALRLFLASKNVELDSEILTDAITLNRSLIKVPFQSGCVELSMSHNIWEFYRSVVEGRRVSLEKKPHRFLIDRDRETWNNWDEWFQKVIWWGNKKGAYLYGNLSVGVEYAGHY